jgi:hypothetical protein
VEKLIEEFGIIVEEKEKQEGREEMGGMGQEL